MLEKFPRIFFYFFKKNLLFINYLPNISEFIFSFFIYQNLCSVITIIALQNIAKNNHIFGLSLRFKTLTRGRFPYPYKS